ncbi:glycerate kinase [Lichenicoccus sp.]|uniref:glycerate kinase n=1 Tax=Lichenicoccus sp. TaxID=2781899 RepID=UPI003D0C6C21
MKFVIAPDSFKESLTAAEAALAIAEGLAESWPGAEMVLRPMSDGGEGLLDALRGITGAETRSQVVQGPFGEPVAAVWGWQPDSRTAFVEMAAASGLMLVPRQARDAGRASSFGTGELVRAALDAGAERIVLGIGGSASNDGGAGLLRALGLVLADAEGAPLPQGGAALAALDRLDASGLDPRLRGVQFDIAADVDNPLLGPNGASAVFGPQKGATPQEVERLDAALRRYAEFCTRATGMDHRAYPGVGAAGGVGYAMKMFTRAVFRPGIEIVAEHAGLPEAVQGADWVFTGEGRLDRQTLGGKTIFGVTRIARAAGVPVIAFAGSLGDGYEAMYAHGLRAAFSLAPGPITLDEAMRDAGTLLGARARDVGRLLLGGSAGGCLQTPDAE